MNLAAELADPETGHTTSPWTGFEVNRGYAVMALPMSRGDVLGLRVFPHSDFGGYRSVWHRSPAGDWAQYVDDAPVEAGCPRAWGPALARAAAAHIDVVWTGPMSLRVRMDEPPLEWWLDAEQDLVLRFVNTIHRRLSLSTWRRPGLVAAREWMLRALGLGPVSLAGTVPAGQHLVAALRRMYWVRASGATLDGRDLGEAVTLRECPTIGGWPLPRRGVLAVGEAHGTIEDREDYDRLRRLTTTEAPDGRDR